MKFVKQPTESDHIAECLAIICRHYGRSIGIEVLRRYCNDENPATNLYDSIAVAERLGFKAMVITPNLERLLHQAPLPCIIQWGQKGFAVIMPGRSSEKIRVTDPAYGIAHYTKKQFSTKWPDTDRDEGDAVLLLAPTPAFYQHRHPKESGTGWSFLSRYFSRYRR